MRIERRGGEQLSSIPEMPRKRHIPEVVKWFEAQVDPKIVEAREKLVKVAQERGVDTEAQRSILETASLAGWIHRNEKRLTGEPYIVHSLEVASRSIRHPAIDQKIIPRATKGLLLHDTVENNPYVTLLALYPHVGLKVAKDVYIYSRKSARDKAQGRDTELSSEAYLHRFLRAREHLRIGKVEDRIYNMKNMPPGALKMYDKYFRRDVGNMLAIIRSLGEKGRSLYNDYREAHNKNKPPDVSDIPPFDETE